MRRSDAEIMLSQKPDTPLALRWLPLIALLRCRLQEYEGWAWAWLAASTWAVACNGCPASDCASHKHSSGSSPSPKAPNLNPSPSLSPSRYRRGVQVLLSTSAEAGDDEQHRAGLQVQRLQEGGDVSGENLREEL